MIKFIVKLFSKSTVPAGKLNRIRGMVVRKDGWSRDSYNMWIDRITIV